MSEWRTEHQPRPLRLNRDSLKGPMFSVWVLFLREDMREDPYLIPALESLENKLRLVKPL